MSLIPYIYNEVVMGFIGRIGKKLVQMLIDKMDLNVGLGASMRASLGI